LTPKYQLLQVQWSLNYPARSVAIVCHCCSISGNRENWYSWVSYFYKHYRLFFSPLL